MRTALASSGSSTLTTWKRRFEGGVVLEVLLVLRPGGGGDGAQLAAGQGRLEQVGRVALARPAPPAPIIVWASSMNRMIGCGDALTSAMTDLSRFSNSPLTPAPACSRPRSSVRTATFFSDGGTSPADDPQGEALDDGRLADAGLAGQDRVVLPAARQDVDHLADLEVAADDRVDLALAWPARSG